MYISLKPLIIDNHRSPLELAQNNFSGTRSINDSQSFADETRSKDMGKKIRNFPPAVPQFIHRENFGLLNNNPPRIDQILKKP